MSDDGTAAARAVAGALAGWGLVLLLAPALPARLGLARADLPEGLVRLLGARRLVQSGAVLLVPRRTVARCGAAVDVLHGASMLGAAVRWPHHRRAALASATTAGLAALAQYLTAPPAR